MHFITQLPLKRNWVLLLEGSSVKKFVNISKPQWKGNIWEANLGEAIRNQHIEANMWKDLESEKPNLFPGVLKALNKKFV